MFEFIVTEMDTRTAQTTVPQSLTAPSWTLIRMGWVTSVTTMMIMMGFQISCPRALITADWFPTRDRKMTTVSLFYPPMQ